MNRKRTFFLKWTPAFLAMAMIIAIQSNGISKVKKTKMNQPNHLMNEKSPYLLQHAYNPVHWFPWGEAAFEKARKEDKPILVSIGYSTCHWCHVMEKESFSSPEIAAIMNQYMVSIKVDREERPDVDKIYMTAVTALTGSGGWPLNVFLTPDLKPFFGGTYFPPEDRLGRIGWPELIKRIGETWKKAEERKKIVESAQNLTQWLEEHFSKYPSENELSPSLLQLCFDSYQQDYDSKFGGFGGAPKFPMPVNHNFLIRYYASLKEKKKLSDANRALEISLKTLRSMAQGGIYDQIGGGFHRYSTDERWHLPHFEKMLYDNAQIAMNYLEAYQVSRDEFFAQIASETLDYILRDMTHPEGGFYSAEDADSLPGEFSESTSNKGENEHKLEGAFYLWKKDEILKILGSEFGEIFSFRYGINPSGNIPSDPYGEFKDKSLLFVDHSIMETAQKFGKSEKEISRILAESKSKLLRERSRRNRPSLDDKILTSWNGLAISAFSRAYQVLDEEKYLRAAQQTGTFIQTHLYDSGEHQLYRRWRKGEKKVKGIVDDYAFLIQGLIDLYEASFKSQWLDWAIELVEEQNRRFGDHEMGGFYMTELNQEKNLILRIKDDSDNVEPSASSVAVLNLLRLAEFTDRKDFHKLAEKTLKFYSSKMKTQPRSFPQMMVALDFALANPYQNIILGDPNSADTKAMIKEIHSRFIPHKIVILLDNESTRNRLIKYLPFLKNLTRIQGKTTAYICVNNSCKLPTNDLLTLKQILNGQ